MAKITGFEIHSKHIDGYGRIFGVLFSIDGVKENKTFDQMDNGWCSSKDARDFALSQLNKEV